MTKALGFLTALPQQLSAKTNDVLVFVIMMAVCLLGATNVGSTGMLLAFIAVIYLYPELSRTWWQAFRSFFLLAVLFLLLLAANSFNYPQALHEAWGATRGLLMGLLAVYLVQVSAEVMRRAVMLAVIACVLLTLVIVGWNIDAYGVQGIIERQGLDTFVHRNRLGEGLATAFILGFAVLLADNQHLHRQKLLVSLLAWLGVITLVNHSRGALLGLVAASVAMLLLWSWRKALLLAVAGAVVALVAKSVGVLDKLVTHNSGTGSIGNGREFLWPPIFERVEQNPWFGYGLHAVNNDPVLQAKHIEAVSHVHSIYLDIIYASGIVGVCFWAVWIVLFTLKMKQVLQPRNMVAAYIGLGLLVYTLAHGTVDFAFYSLGTFATLAFSGVLTIGLLARELKHENTAHS